MNNENNDFRQIDRNIVTKATLIDIALDKCLDSSEYDNLIKSYEYLLSKYDLFGKPFTEDATKSDYHFSSEEEDVAVIVCDNGKFGVQESLYYNKIEPVYDSIEQLDKSSLLRVFYNGKYGIIDLDYNGKVVIPCEYDSIEVSCGDFFSVIVEKNGKFQYQGNGCSDWLDEIIFPKYAGWIVVRQGERYGWLDENLEITFDRKKANAHILLHTLDLIHISKEYHVATREEIDKCTDLDIALRNCNEEERKRLDKELLSLSATLCRGLDFSVFTSEGKVGLKDYFGGTVVPAIYDEIKKSDDHKHKDICFGRIDDSWGKVAELGHKVSSPIIEFDEPTHEFCYGCWTVVKKKGKYGVYDSFKEKYLLDPIYDELIEEENYHHIITRIGDRFGFFDYEFNIPPRFEQYKIGRSLSFVRVMLNGKWGYINEKGKWTERIEEARAYVRNPMYFFRK